MASSDLDNTCLSNVKVDTATEIGEGSFGRVFQGSFNGAMVAVKLLKSPSRAPGFVEDLLTEAAIWRRVQQHANIVNFHGIYKTSDGQVGLVSDFMDGTLLTFLREEALRHEEGKPLLMTVADKVKICIDVCSALAELQANGIIHGDLAARNVLYKGRPGHDATFLITDFGMAAQSCSSSATYTLLERSKVPVRWSPPEVLRRGEYSSASDVWSFGVLMWEIFSLGEVPFGLSTSNGDAIRRIHHPKKSRLLARPKDLCPRDVYSLICCCWVRQRRERPSLATLARKLEQLHSRHAVEDETSNTIVDAVEYCSPDYLLGRRRTVT